MYIILGYSWNLFWGDGYTGTSQNGSKRWMVDGLNTTYLKILKSPPSYAALRCMTPEDVDSLQSISHLDLSFLEVEETV